MNTAGFLSECEKRGISITVEGQDLIVQPDNIERRTVEYIKGHKQEIIDTLTTPVWNGGALAGGDCYSCGEHTGAMLTVPYGFVGWCCIDCFDKRASEPLHRLAA